MYYTPPLLVSGTAVDNVNVKEVRIKLWKLASGTGSWSKVLTLTRDNYALYPFYPGYNTIYVQAVDTSDNPSEVYSRTFVYRFQVHHLPPEVPTLLLGKY